MQNIGILPYFARTRKQAVRASRDVIVLREEKLTVVVSLSLAGFALVGFS